MKLSNIAANGQPALRRAGLNERQLECLPVNEEKL